MFSRILGFTIGTFPKGQVCINKYLFLLIFAVTMSLNYWTYFNFSGKPKSSLTIIILLLIIILNNNLKVTIGWRIYQVKVFFLFKKQLNQVKCLINNWKKFYCVRYFLPNSCCDKKQQKSCKSLRNISTLLYKVS